jgi:hypothetical protein
VSIVIPPKALSCTILYTTGNKGIGLSSYLSSLHILRMILCFPSLLSCFTAISLIHGGSSSSCPGFNPHSCKIWFRSVVHIPNFLTHSVSGSGKATADVGDAPFCASTCRSVCMPFRCGVAGTVTTLRFGNNTSCRALPHVSASSCALFENERIGRATEPCNLVFLVFAARKNALIPLNSSGHCSVSSVTLILSHKMGADMSSVNSSYARYAGHGIALSNRNFAVTEPPLNHGVPSSF